MADEPSQYRYIGTAPDNLDTGRPLAPGDFVKPSDLTYEHTGEGEGEETDRLVPNDQRLFDEGLLISGDVVPQEQEDAAPALQGQALDEALEDRGLLEGNKSKSADEKRQLIADHDAALSEEQEA